MERKSYVLFFGDEKVSLVPSTEKIYVLVHGEYDSAYFAIVSSSVEPILSFITPDDAA